MKSRLTSQSDTQKECTSHPLAVKHMPCESDTHKICEAFTTNDKRFAEHRHRSRKTIEYICAISIRTLFRGWRFARSGVSTSLFTFFFGRKNHDIVSHRRSDRRWRWQPLSSRVESNRWCTKCVQYCSYYTSGLHPAAKIYARVFFFFFIEDKSAPKNIQLMSYSVNSVLRAVSARTHATGISLARKICGEINEWERNDGKCYERRRHVRCSPGYIWQFVWFWASRTRTDRGMFYSGN